MLAHRRRRTWAACVSALSIAGFASAAHAAAECRYIPALDARGPQTEVATDPSLMDAAVGAYRVDDYDLWNVMTISRDGDHLVAHMIGRPAVTLVPIGPNIFVYGTLDDEIVVQATGSGQVSGLVWRRNHLRDLPMPRITPAQATELEVRFSKRIDPQGQPHSQTALLGLVDQLQTGKPDYDRMSIYLQIATHRQLTTLRPFLNDLGPVQSVRFLGFMGEGLNGVPGETYDVMRRDGVSGWHIAVDDHGVIAGADVGCGP
jgi:hypothetical protein